MRALPRVRRHRLARPLGAGLAVVGLVFSLGSPVAAGEDDPRLRQAQQERVEVQGRLDGLLSRLSELELQAEETDERLTRLTEQAGRERAQADSASEALAHQVRQSYVHGTTDPALTMLVSASPREAMEQARVLGLLARRSRADYEVAANAQVRTRVASGEVEVAAAELRDREGELRGAQDEVTQLVAQAEAQEVAVRDTIAAEEVARQQAEAQRRERERVARERAARQQVAEAEVADEAAQEQADEAAQEQAAPRAAVPDGATDTATDSAGGGGTGATRSVAQVAPPDTAAPETVAPDSGTPVDTAPAGAAAPAPAPPPPAAPAPPPPVPEPEPEPAPAPAGGGVSCPVGQPRTYSDTWGAARSGGRSHKGTDILAPHGTPIYAYESGTISRANSNSLGGISLYLQGDSGNVYYYTHLSGYVGGIAAGVQVASGQHIASNGDTGNARGIPHLHFEVMPGGGSSVNPYPYVLRACG